MQIPIETFGEVIVAHAPDEFTEEAALEFARALKQPIESGRNRVVAQMERSDVFDSAALETLLELHEQLRSSGGNLTICSLSDTGRKIFEMTRLSEQFDVFDAVVDAVAAMQ